MSEDIPQPKKLSILKVLGGIFFAGFMIIAFVIAAGLISSYERSHTLADYNVDYAFSPYESRDETVTEFWINSPRGKIAGPKVIGKNPEVVYRDVDDDGIDEVFIESQGKTLIGFSVVLDPETKQAVGFKTFMTDRGGP